MNIFIWNFATCWIIFDFRVESRKKILKICQLEKHYNYYKIFSALIIFFKKIEIWHFLTYIFEGRYNFYLLLTLKSKMKSPKASNELNWTFFEKYVLNTDIF